MLQTEAVNGRIRIIVIVGTTAAGKSELALDLADRFGGEIVSADSMQVYRYMDIGTAKPTSEERGRIVHHLIDVVDPDEEFSAAVFVGKADAAIGQANRRGKRIFVAGGTGLYVKALLGGLLDGPGSDGEVRRSCREHVRKYGTLSLHEKLREIDPRTAARIHPSDVVRVIRAVEVFRLTGRSVSELRDRHEFADRRYAFLKIGLHRDRKDLLERIDRRTDRMIERGLVEEVRELLRKGYAPDVKPLQSIGYRHVVGHLRGDCALDEAVGRTKRDTRRYAKRQMTWFGADSEIQWHPMEEKDRIYWKIERFLSP